MKKSTIMQIFVLFLVGVLSSMSFAVQAFPIGSGTGQDDSTGSNGIPDGSVINVDVPSSFSLRDGWTAHVTNYQDMQIRLEKIYDANDPLPLGSATDGQKVCTTDVKQCPDGSYVARTMPNCEFAPCPTGKKTPYVIVSISTPGGCGPNADPRCLGPPGFSMTYTLAKGESVDVLGLTLSFEDVFYGQTGDKEIIEAHFKLFEQGVPEPKRSTECPANCECYEGYSVCRGDVSPGDEPTRVSNNGTIYPAVTITQEAEGKTTISKGEISAKTESKVTVKGGNLVMETSQGEKPIKVMPDTASDVAINQLKLKDFEIELKDAGKPIYEVRGTEEVKILGFIKARMPVSSQIDAETGTVIATKRPWWGFFAR